MLRCQGRGQSNSHSVTTRQEESVLLILLYRCVVQGVRRCTLLMWNRHGSQHLLGSRTVGASMQLAWEGSMFSQRCEALETTCPFSHAGQYRACLLFPTLSAHCRLSAAKNMERISQEAAWPSSHHHHITIPLLERKGQKMAFSPLLAGTETFISAGSLWASSSTSVKYS